VPAAADALAPAGRRGAVQGLISMGGAVGRMLGPLLGGFLYAAGNPASLYLVMAAIFVAAGIVYGVHDRVGMALPETVSAREPSRRHG